MIIHFWGVRGSSPTPLTPQQIKSKIMAVVQRITPDDLKSIDTRARFLTTLPDWIYGTTGGNTPCVEIKSANTELVFDAGTGIREYGKSKNIPADNHYNLFFTHFHWDHIHGLPFFGPAYNPASKIDVFSPFDNTEEYLSDQMKNPYFPVPFESFTKNFTWNKVIGGEQINLENVKITACKMNHPGDSYSYAVCEGDKKFVLATDVELRAKDFKKSPEMELVFKNADCMAIDSQYTVEEAYRKKNWGHSAFCYAVDFAVFWNIKKIYLFHHEPAYDDKKLNSILQAARWYAQYIHHSDIEIELAKEDLEIIL